MGKINYELASWICIYESNVRTIKQLEKHYEAHPYKYIKEEIIACLKYQKDLLKKINSCGFSKFYFDTLKVNKKYAKESRELKKLDKQASKVVNSKKSSKATYKVATALLITSLLIGSTPNSTSTEEYIGETECTSSITEEVAINTKECVDETEYTPEIIEKLVEKNELTTETVEVKMPEAIGYQPEITYYTIELENKHYDINCSEGLQEYFYELEEKWNVPASVAMLLVDQESNGQWSTNGVVSPTNDYGLPQINECNLNDIEEKLGYSKDDILYDPYKSLDAMFYLLNNIFTLYDYTIDNYDIENVCGTYNGYIKWRDKEQSLNYVSECMERYNTVFTDDRDTEMLLVQNKY